jgi:peptidoglycan/LPS O-acetylase OafA/YrhL
LSGFVLAHVYGRRLVEGMTFTALMRARLIRLYPLYLVGALAGGALAVLSVVRGWDNASAVQLAWSALFALLMLPCPPGLSMWRDAPYPYDGPAWSLFFELAVNAVFALIGRWLTPALCLIFMAIGGVLLIPTAFHFGQLDGGFAWSNFVAGFPRVTFAFFAGVWIYQTKIYERAPALPAWAALVLLLAAFAVPASGTGRAVFDLLATLVIFPALVTFSAGSRADGAWFPLCSAAGLLSYGVYILHVPLWSWLQVFMGRFGLDFPGFADVVLTAGAALLAAAVLNAVYDKPLRATLVSALRERR